MRGLTFVLALVGGAAFAAPPPPPPPGWHPPGVPKELGGYELRPIFLDYRDWIDKGRGRALRLAVDYEPRWQGKQHWGDLIRSEIEDYDHGTVRVDRLERYCDGDWLRKEQPSNCIYRYRYAIPADLSTPQLQKRILESFRPETLVKRLAAHEWVPGKARGRDEKLIHIFEEHVAEANLRPSDLYRPLVEAHEVRASQCPDLETSLAGLDRIVLGLAPQGQPDPGAGLTLPVHGAHTRVTLQAYTRQNQPVEIEGTTALYPLLRPIWDAVKKCAEGEAARLQ